MFSLNRLHITFIAALFAALTACGGGASSEGGVGGSGISMGVMQDQNQSGTTKTATVNGVTFDTANTAYFEEGGSANAGNIQNGMVVVVQGSIDANGTTGTANSIAYRDLLEGPITNITASTITAMAQTILVDANTRYQDANGAMIAHNDLRKDDVIEVSGFFTASGSIYATYIELTNNATHGIKGIVTAVDPNVGFNIGMLRVNWIDTTNINVGDLLQAEGTMNGNTTLNATSVASLNKSLDVADADDAEVEGLVTTTCSPVTQGTTLPCTFKLGFITVQVRNNTEFENGVLADIQPGTRIEVEGNLTNNIVNADEIEFKNSVEIISDVSAITSNTFDLEYGATDVTVTYDSMITELDSINNFSDIRIGDHLKVRARKSGSSLVATRIEDSRGNTDLALQGLVESVSEPIITLQGVTLNTNSFSMNFRYRDKSGLEISQSQFFAGVAVNKLVKLKGNINSGGATITWREIRLQ